MGKRLAVLGLALLLAHCADPYAAAPTPGPGDPGGAGSATDGGAQDGASDVRLAIEPVADIIVLPGASTTTVPIAIVRNGVEGPVTVTLAGLPQGVSAAAVTIAPTATSAEATVAVSPKAQFPVTVVTLTATAGSDAASRTTRLVVRGEAGTVDASFGTGGVAANVLGGVSGAGAGLAIRADGSFVLLANGDDGALLATVGRQGEVAAPPTALPFTSASALVVDQGGALVVGGEERGMLALGRYRSADLGPDDLFGQGGRAIVGDGGPAAGVRSIVPRRDGFLVLHEASNRARIAALTATGAREASWGTAGTSLLPQGMALSLLPYGASYAAFTYDEQRAAYAVTTLGPGGEQLESTMLPATAGAVTAATRPHGASTGSTAYLPTVGASASTYNLVRVTSPRPLASAVDVTSAALATAVQPDGKVILAFASLGRVVLGRFEPKSGARDITFGATGLVGLPIDAASSPRIYLQPDGRLVGFANVEKDKRTRVSMFRVWL